MPTIVEAIRQAINNPVSGITHETDVAFIIDMVKSLFPDLIDWEDKGKFTSFRHSVYEERRKLDPDYIPPTKSATREKKNSGSGHSSSQNGSLTHEQAINLLADLNLLMDHFPSGDEFAAVVEETAKLLAQCGGSVETLLSWSKLITVNRIQPK